MNQAIIFVKKRRHIDYVSFLILTIVNKYAMMRARITEEGENHIAKDLHGLGRYTDPNTATI